VPVVRRGPGPVRRWLKFLCAAVAADLLAVAGALAAPGNVLTLPDLLEQAARTHPSMRGARLDSQAARQDVETARLQRWPTLSANIESRDSNAATSSARALALEQTLWDGGRVTSQIAQATVVERMAGARISAVQQELWLQVVAAWQAYLSAQGRVAVANDTLDRLAGYRATMERRVRAEASPRIELELVEARTLQTQVELNQAQAARRIAVARLEELTGLPGLQAQLYDPPEWPAEAQLQRAAQLCASLDVDAVAAASPAVELARGDAEVARRRLEYKEAEKWPQAYLRISRPVGSALPNADMSTAVFVGVRYTPGAGFSQFSEARSMVLRMQSADEAVEAARREAANALRADSEEFVSALDRMKSADSSADGAALVLASYLRQFQGARKTWQDVLNAARELAQNEYSRVDTRATLAGALYRLQIRLGRETGAF
jgi:adhesin transport system outer membrane protein